MISKRSWLAVLVSVATPLSSARASDLPGWAHELGPEPAIDSLPDAATIMAKTLAIYAAADSYQDTGTIQAVVKDGAKPPASTTRRFSTTFRRPSAFRFIIGAGESTTIVWHDGENNRTWRQQQESIPRDLNAAVVDAAMTMNVPWSFHVLTLLLPETTKSSRLWAPPTSDRLTRLADGTHEGRACYRLQQLDDKAGHARRVFWIDRSRQLLVRVDERAIVDLADGPEVSIDKQVRFRPVLNRPVPAGALAYRRPRLE